MFAKFSHTIQAIACRHCLHAGLCLLVMLGAAVLDVHDAVAQNTYAAREVLRGKLNAKMTALSGADSVAITAADIDSLNLLGPSGECVTLTDDTLIVLVRSGSDVVMKIRTAPQSTMIIPPGSHNMVCDLELAWLKRYWGEHLYTRIATHPFAKTGNACYNIGTHRFAQDYMMWAIFGTNATGLKDSLKEKFADWGIHDRPYRVVIDSSTLDEDERSGRCILPHGDGTTSHDTLQYMAKRVALADSDVADAKAAYSEVRFNPAFPMATGKVVTGVSIDARLQKYSPLDCFMGGALHFLPPDDDSAYVRITFYTMTDSASPATEYIWRKFATSSADTNNDSLWNFFDQDFQWKLDSWCNFDIDTAGYLVFNALPGDGEHQCTSAGTYRIMRLRSPIVPARYCTFACAVGDTFELDSMAGTIACRHAGIATADSLETVQCLDFCTMLSGYRTVDNVIAASAQRFENVWPYDQAEFLTGRVLGTWLGENTSNNVYELGQRTWRPAEAYAYRTPTKTGGKLLVTAEHVWDSAGIFINEDGTTTDAFHLFDWRNPDANAGTKWLLGSTVTLFSPYGEPLEERDILGIYSAARFSHRNIVPRLVAKNARYGSVGYESFEDGKGTAERIAHSGRWSCRLPDSMGLSDPIMRLIVTDQIMNKGLLIRLWAKQTYHDAADSVITIKCPDFCEDDPFRKIAQTGEWTLYEKICVPDAGKMDIGDTIMLRFYDSIHVPSGDTVWIDDVRAQPFDAEMICYAYDAATLRPIVQFDDQHFGEFFQYNGEGKLVRKIRETERGMKTVAETQYHMPTTYSRDGTLLSMARRGPEGSANTMRRRGGARGDRGNSENASGQGSTIDLLDMNIGADGVQTRLFGGRSIDPRSLSLDSLRAMLAIDTARLAPGQMERLRAAGLGDVEKLKDLAEIGEIDRRLAMMADRKQEELSGQEREQLQRTLADLQERRRTLMRDRLGVDEDGLRRLYRSLQDAQTEPAKEGK